MKKICLMITAVCLAVCAFCLSSSYVVAEEQSDIDYLSEVYQNECEKINEQNDYYESLIRFVEEDWFFEEENGKMYWAISDEEISNIDPEVVEFMNQSMSEKNQLIDDNLIVQTENGEIELADDIENDYYVQSGAIEVIQRYKKVWIFTIWIGFDLVCNNNVASIVLASMGILLDLVSIITDISVIWKTPEVAVNIAKTYCYSLHTVIREMSALLSGIPKAILTGIEIMWKSLVVGTTGVFGIIISVLKLGFPKTIQSFDIIKHAANGGNVKFTYTTVVFTGYTLL